MGRMIFFIATPWSSSDLGKHALGSSVRSHCSNMAMQIRKHPLHRTDDRIAPSRLGLPPTRHLSKLMCSIFVEVLAKGLAISGSLVIGGSIIGPFQVNLWR